MPDLTLTEFLAIAILIAIAFTACACYATVRATPEEVAPCGNDVDAGEA